MKVSISRKINFFDIGTDYRITLASLFRVLQEASSKHSDDAENAMTAESCRWILNRMAAQVDRYPTYGETVTAVTWHRGSKGYKAFRDYELYANGERLAAATSVWLYYDMNARRLLKVPTDTGKIYGMETGTATAIDITGWKPVTDFAPDHKTHITTRPTDYDPLHHVNNVVYYDYLLSLLRRSGMDPGRVSSVTLQYDKQIGQEIDAVQAACSLSDHRGVFKIYSDDTVFASGDFEYK